IGSSKTAKATTNPTCILTNLNTKTRSSTLYANARSVLDSISLNFQRQPEATSNVKFQRRSTERARRVKILEETGAQRVHAAVSALRGGASEVEAVLTLVRGVRAL